jgi:hypothetical protein
MADGPTHLYRLLRLRYNLFEGSGVTEGLFGTFRLVFASTHERAATTPQVVPLFWTVFRSATVKNAPAAADSFQHPRPLYPIRERQG